MTTRPISGTQKADVYSFAIVLQEITCRAMPFYYDTLDVKCDYYIQRAIINVSIVTAPLAGVQSIAISMSVCLSVCLYVCPLACLKTQCLLWVLRRSVARNFRQGCVNLQHSSLSIPVQLPYQVGRTIKKRRDISYR